MLKRTWLFVLPVVASLLWLGTGPSQAAGENFVVNQVTNVGCADDTWDLNVTRSGLDGGGGYTTHTVVSSGGLVYMSEAISSDDNFTGLWELYADSGYGPTTGTFPIPAGQPMKAVFTVERPKGHILSSWTMVAASCNSNQLLYNGPTGADGDGDYVPVLKDGCPTLQAFTANGCPVRARTLAVNAKYHPRRVVGQLSSPGYPKLSAGRIVTIWKVRPGPDRKVATRTTNSLGKFGAQVGSGRYYARSAAVIVPTSGLATADISNVAKVN